MKPAKQQPITFRPTDEIQVRMDAWLSLHSYIDRTTLVNMALAKFLSGPQTLEAVEVVPASRDQVIGMLGQVLSEHKDTMDDLKDR